jgi:hypothetical protein
MRSFAAFAAFLMAVAAHPLAAQEIAYEPVGFEDAVIDGGGARFVAAEPVDTPQGIAAFGPFRVLDGARAALVDVTDQRSPAAFEQMLRAYPGIALLEMRDCPGTEDDRANLQLGRMIRASGIATYVPAGGSVRSGGVELFLAGARRYADPGAEFAVHAWMDEDGREADDYAASAPENRKYLDYYRHMGLSESQANAFYAMTNSVPHAEALWFDGAGMADWVRLDRFEG